MTVLLVFAGGAVGSVARYLTDRWVQSRHRWHYPLGTLAVNLAGCLIVGVVGGGVTKAGWSPDVQHLLVTGFCGGLTTFSAFSVEIVHLAEGRRGARAASYAVLSVGAGIALAAAGWAMA